MDLMTQLVTLVKLVKDRQYLAAVVLVARIIAAFGPLVTPPAAAGGTLEAALADLEGSLGRCGSEREAAHTENCDAALYRATAPALKALLVQLLQHS